MGSTMREYLIDFIKAASAKQTGENRHSGHPAGDGPWRRHQFVLSTREVSLSFGYGYFDHDKVLFDSTEMTVEEGVDRFLAATDLDK